jgi:hypothetical protein
MRKLFSNGVVALAGFVVPHETGHAERVIPIYTKDPRLLQLQELFEKLRSPAIVFAEDFLAAADRHNLDWRLLPSIAIIESGGGKEYRNNNIFGWDNCRRRFPSIAAGIHLVAERLSRSSLYRDKSLDEILQTYNNHEGYAQRVKFVMRRLTPAADYVN